MPLVSMNMDLYGCNAETLPAKVSKMLQLFHGGICLANHHTNTEAYYHACEIYAIHNYYIFIC